MCCAELGWRAKLSVADHPVSHYEFDVLIGGDGKRNTLKGLDLMHFPLPIYMYMYGTHCT